ncbi:MAG: pentapeptide repeat-containing protein [Magnetococcales bacterium]|nr:pentapeptide repeat-containing protein [Magnetococcales bacterium]
MLIGILAVVLILTTTDRMLLVGEAVKIPLLDVSLNVVEVYRWGPVLWVAINLNLLLVLEMFARKSRALQAVWPGGVASLPVRLYPFPFGHWLARCHTGPISWFLHLYVWVTCLILPVGVLLMAELRFLAYHDFYVTVQQAFFVSLQLALLWFFWPRIVASAPPPSEWWISFQMMARRKLILLALLTLGVSVVALFPEKILSGLQEITGSHYRFSYCLKVSDEILVKQAPSSELIAAYATQNKPGGAVWLEHAEGLDLRGRDLSCADLSDSRLYRVRFDKTSNLAGMNLFGADLSEAGLPGANLERTDLTWAQLPGAYMVGAKLSGTKLNPSNLAGVNLRSADLSGADLGKADLSGANLRDADLSGADLREAHLSGADLRDANLSGSSLNDADLRLARMRGASMEGTDLRMARLDGLLVDSQPVEKGVKANGICLTGADLRGASLGQADLTGMGNQKDCGQKGVDWEKIREKLSRLPDERKEKVLERLKKAEERWLKNKNKGFLVSDNAPFPAGDDTPGRFVEGKPTSFKDAFFDTTLQEILRANGVPVPNSVSSQEHHDQYLPFLAEKLYCLSVPSALMLSNTAVSADRNPGKLDLGLDLDRLFHSMSKEKLHSFISTVSDRNCADFTVSGQSSWEWTQWQTVQKILRKIVEEQRQKRLPSAPSDSTMSPVEEKRHENPRS